MTIYRDLNQDDPITKPFLVGSEAIAQSIENIFSTLRGEKYFDPEFPGESLDDYLFELINETNAFGILRIIQDLIRNNQPLVEIDQRITKITPNYETQSYDVTVGYTEVGDLEGRLRIFTGNFERSN